MNTTVDTRGASTGPKMFVPFLVVDAFDPSSTGDPTKVFSSHPSATLEPVRSDTSDPKERNIFVTYNKRAVALNTLWLNTFNTFVIQNSGQLGNLCKYGGEQISNNTMISPITFNLSGDNYLGTPVFGEDIQSDDSSEARVELKELVSAFLEDVQTEEAQERFGLAISDIIDRYGKVGIAAWADLFQPTLEPLFWRFLNALGARRGQPTDDVAKQILLRQLNSVSAGRRSAAASALGSFPDGVVLTALERRAAVEKNRMVLATLHAHIRTLRRDALSAPKIL